MLQVQEIILSLSKKFPQSLCLTSDARTHVILFWELNKCINFFAKMLSLLYPHPYGKREPRRISCSPSDRQHPTRHCGVLSCDIHTWSYQWLLVELSHQVIGNVLKKGEEQRSTRSAAAYARWSNPFCSVVMFDLWQHQSLLQKCTGKTLVL